MSTYLQHTRIYEEMVKIIFQLSSNYMYALHLFSCMSVEYRIGGQEYRLFQLEYLSNIQVNYLKKIILQPVLVKKGSKWRLIWEELREKMCHMTARKFQARVHLHLCDCLQLQDYQTPHNLTNLHHKPKAPFSQCQYGPGSPRWRTAGIPT